MIFWFYSLLFFSLTLCQEKNFVIDICSYNNKDWYERNLDSVVRQTYPHYRVVYTDDYSSDGTADLVAAYINERGIDNKITLVRNPFRTRQLANHWRVIHACHDDEIIIHLDGDDWFAHDNVLKELNQAYQDTNVWMTYGNYRWWPSGKIDNLDWIPRKITARNKYRTGDYRQGAYHPRSFYAWLAKQVKLEDLMCPFEPFKGKFLPAVADWALLYPMLEMAGGRFKCFRKVHYIYNNDNPLNYARVARQLQNKCGDYLDRKKSYTKLEGPVKTPNVADIPVYYFCNNPQAAAAISLLRKNVTGISTIYEFNEQTMKAHEVNGTITIFPVEAPGKFEEAVAQASYVVLLYDQLPPLQQVDAQKCVHALIESNADIFCLDQLCTEFAYEWLYDDIYFFQVKNVDLGRLNPHFTVIKAQYLLQEVVKATGGLYEVSFEKFFRPFYTKKLRRDAAGLFLK